MKEAVTNSGERRKKGREKQELKVLLFVGNKEQVYVLYFPAVVSWNLGSNGPTVDRPKWSYARSDRLKGLVVLGVCTYLSGM